MRLCRGQRPPASLARSRLCVHDPDNDLAVTTLPAETDGRVGRRRDEFKQSRCRDTVTLRYMFGRPSALVHDVRNPREKGNARGGSRELRGKKRGLAGFSSICLAMFFQTKSPGQILSRLRLHEPVWANVIGVGLLGSTAHFPRLYLLSFLLCTRQLLVADTRAHTAGG